MAHRLKLTTICFVAAATLCLSACSGGGATSQPTPQTPSGGSSGPVSAPPSVTGTADDFRTKEYQANWGLEAIGAADAYAQGYSGKGVTIGIVDYNFDFSSPEVNFSAASAGENPAYRAIYEAQIGQGATSTPHGQAVAVIAAGVKNDVDTHGVAFGATVLGIDFFSGVNAYQTSQNGVLYTVSDPWTYAVQHGARVINKSFGYDEGDVIANPPQVSQRYVLDDSTNAVAAGALLVASAGNNSGSEPSLSNLDALDQLQANGLLSSGNGAMLIVGAVDQNNQIADFSDKAGDGIAKNYYLVAPGVRVVAPWVTDTDGAGLYYLNGTSFSAPHVSGAAALLFERWPTLTARQVANILLDTATDLGVAGVDNVYGHGLLNVAAALKPVGASAIAVRSGQKPQVPVTQTGLRFGAAFGDVPGLKASLKHTMILDSYHRDFQIDTSGMVSTSDPAMNILARMDARADWRASALTLGPGTMSYVVNLDKRLTPERALMGEAGENLGPKVSASFEFTGSYAGSKWAIGTGRSLTDALARTPVDDPVAGRFSLTGASDPVLPTGQGAYLLTGKRLGEDTDLWVGAAIASVSGEKNHPVRALQGDSRTLSVAARLVHYLGIGQFGTELGLTRESDSVLGSRSAGGFALSGGADTAWLTVDGNAWLGDGFSLSARLTGTATRAASAASSLFAGTGTIYGTSFSLIAAKEGALAHNDSLSLSLYQPLRVERAVSHYVTGTGLNPDTGDVLFRSRRVSLAPSGRELAVEAAYSLTLDGWLMEANLGHRFDAGHIAGLQDTLMMLGLSRRF
ncbi:S8 family peptidase [Kordiimonas marina]|uniref:S8 family peptidase n=1 Tax=Kordiimonas marina TaxID=2872312 RepID=UPI001FF4FA80|nr:S8 family peptidase [Kordiimonas marina]MCJ9427828.1 S8 family serine peptidase [Kordiimonas marina]